MTFAVIKTGGKQYKVAPNDVIKIEKIAGEPGDVVTFDEILMVGEGDDVTVGAPLVEGASVAAHFVSTKKQRTVIILKKERRQHYDRRNGHRQLLSTVRISEILTGGKKHSTKVDEVAKARYEKAAAASGASESVSEAPAAKKAAPAKKTAAKKTETKTKAEPKAAADGFVDDLKLIGGVGPALEKKLNGIGITSLKQIAEWTAEDVASFDDKLDFKGRIERDEWVKQAQDLVAGKSDQAATEKKPAKKAASKKSDQE
ncbi:50S ribosomal protein L21 [Devosia sp.]|uniref:50S ribosomal protein L21 n=1 Tax=Devosia sp. TaxID=1871048 RepID=UPI003A906E2C